MYSYTIIISVVSRRSHLPESREGSGYARPGEGSGYTRPGEGSGYTKPDEDQDFTGDSGFSSSSKYFDDSDPYCVVDLWRRPPPNSLAPQKKGKTKYCSYVDSMPFHGIFDGENLLFVYKKNFMEENFRIAGPTILYVDSL